MPAEYCVPSICWEACLSLSRAEWSASLAEAVWCDPCPDMLQDSLDGSRELGVTLVGGDRPGTALYLSPSSWTHYRDLDLVPECLPRYVYD